MWLSPHQVALLTFTLAALQAYDARQLRYVACKIHQLTPQWSEDRKRNYVRHAVRALPHLWRPANLLLL